MSSNKESGADNQQGRLMMAREIRSIPIRDIEIVLDQELLEIGKFSQEARDWDGGLIVGGMGKAVLDIARLLEKRMGVILNIRAKGLIDQSKPSSEPSETIRSGPI